MPRSDGRRGIKGVAHCSGWCLSLSRPGGPSRGLVPGARPGGPSRGPVPGARPGGPSWGPVPGARPGGPSRGPVPGTRPGGPSRVAVPGARRRLGDRVHFFCRVLEMHLNKVVFNYPGWKQTSNSPGIEIDDALMPLIGKRTTISMGQTRLYWS
ncbi:hypothetical protein T492DRAFT_119417 [Pavlovales sp. CCMP2436]|nr:hypothetical protein T492DRAFT_119417 [Pavlovales sp. CCMP2436]